MSGVVGSIAVLKASGGNARGIYFPMRGSGGTAADDGKPRVAVVDDDKMTADTLTAVLRQAGFAAHALYSGEETLEWIEQNHPQIVLTDIRMRKVTGIETATRVRELHPECRILLFSASALSEADRRQIERLGLEFLERPLHPRELLTRLKKTDEPAA